MGKAKTTEGTEAAKMTAGKPDCVVINVRDVGGTYRAKAAGRKELATCTMGRRHAVAACAEKIYGRGAFSLKEVTIESWMATAIEREEVANG